MKNYEKFQDSLCDNLVGVLVLTNRVHKGSIPQYEFSCEHKFWTNFGPKATICSSWTSNLAFIFSSIGPMIHDSLTSREFHRPVFINFIFINLFQLKDCEQNFV